MRGRLRRRFLGVKLHYWYLASLECSRAIVFSLFIAAALLIGTAPLCAFAETSELGRAALVWVSLSSGMFLALLLLVIIVTSIGIKVSEEEK